MGRRSWAASSPLGARHTASMTLTARAAVAITPPWLWSIPAQSQVRVDLDAGAAVARRHGARRVGRRAGTGQSGAAASVSRLTCSMVITACAVADALDREPDGGDLSGFDAHHRAVDRLRGHPLLVALADLVEFDAEIYGQAAHLDTPHRGQHAGREHDRGVVGRGAETETDTGEFGVVVAAVVADLLHRDRGGARGQAQRRVHQGVAGEAGVDTVDVQRRVARRAGLRQRLAQPVVGLIRRDQPDKRRPNDIGARPQKPA